MKKVVLLMFVLFAVFVVYNRQRLFLRDPLASVTRDGVKEEGAEVFINYSNDVLVQNDRTRLYVTMVQSGQVGTPALLRCLRWTACLTDRDVATLVPATSPASVMQMTAKVVEYHDADGKDVRVSLR